MGEGGEDGLRLLMPCILLLFLLGFSCQSVAWREPTPRLPSRSTLDLWLQDSPGQDSPGQDLRDRGSEVQDLEALGGRRLPPSVIVTEQDRKAEEEASKEAKVRNEVAIYIMTGIRRIQSSVFDEQQTMQATGVEFAWIPKGWPIGLEIGAQWSKNKTDVLLNNEPATIEGFMAELYFGPRLQGEVISLFDYPISAYLGGGATGMYVNIDRERSGIKQSDDGFAGGWYGHTGLFVPGPGSSILGFDLRWVGGSSLTLFGERSSADGFQVSILAAIEF